MKILVAGATSSIHTGRFASLLQEIGHEVRVFNCEIHFGEDEFLRDTPIYVAYARPSANNNIIINWPRPHIWRLLLSDAPQRASGFRAWGRFGSRLAVPALTRIIRQWKPSLIISLKMQNDGYTVAKARKEIGRNFPLWLHFNWGTDIAHFGLSPEEREYHVPRIKELLQLCDFHIADCDRDVRLAKEFGFTGRSLGACLANGGFELEVLNKIRGSAGTRDTIIVKGREWPPVSVGMNVVKALDLLADEVRPYRVKFMMCTPDVEEAVYDRIEKGMPFEVMPRLPYRDLLKEYARARFTIAATHVDGTPLFLAETMAMGSVPIHSDLESVREWVVDGENGLLFGAEDVSSLASQIRRALRDDKFIAHASKSNIEIAAARMNRDNIRHQIAATIAEIVTERGRAG